MAPEVAVFEGEPLPFGRGEEGCLAGETGGDSVGTGVFGPYAETESGRDVPVEDESSAADAAGGIVEIVETIAGEREGTAFGCWILTGGCRCGDEQQ